MNAAGNPMNFVILDACRNNPFIRSFRSSDKGLAQMNAPDGSLIAYSTAPGSVARDGNGRNGIYTAELLKKMRVPNLDVVNMFRQVRVAVREKTDNKQTPWESNSLLKDFYFGGSNDSAVATNTVPTTTNNRWAVEVSFWDSIKYSDDPRDFQDYLDRYPSGKFASLAHRRIQRLRENSRNNSTTDNDLVQPTVPIRRSLVADASLFTFELERCLLSGTTVFCDLFVTNKDIDRKLFFSRSYLFDDFNNQTKSSRIELANNKSWSVTAFLVSGVRTKARVIFNGILAKANKASLLTLNFDSTNTQRFKVNFRNVPLRENTRSFSNLDSQESSPNNERITESNIDRSNNTNTITVKAGRGWVDSGLNVSPGMKINVTVFGGIQY